MNMNEVSKLQVMHLKNINVPYQSFFLVSNEWRCHLVYI